MFRGSLLSSNYILIKNITILSILGLIGGSLYIMWPRAVSQSAVSRVNDPLISSGKTKPAPIEDPAILSDTPIKPIETGTVEPLPQNPPSPLPVESPKMIQLPEGVDPTSTDAIAFSSTSTASTTQPGKATASETLSKSKTNPTVPSPTPIPETKKESVIKNIPDGTCDGTKNDKKTIKTQYQYSIEEGKGVRPSRKGYDSCQYTESLAIVTPSARVVVEEAKPNKEIISYEVSPSGEHITYNTIGPDSTAMAVYDVKKQRHIDEALVIGFAYGFDTDEKYFFSCSQKELGTGTIKIYNLEDDSRKFLFPENEGTASVGNIWVESCSQLDAGTNSFSYSLRDTSNNEVKDYVYSFKDGSLK